MERLVGIIEFIGLTAFIVALIFTLLGSPNPLKKDKEN